MEKCASIMQILFDHFQRNMNKKNVDISVKYQACKIYSNF